MCVCGVGGSVRLGRFVWGVDGLVKKMKMRTNLLQSKRWCCTPEMHGAERSAF